MQPALRYALSALLLADAAAYAQTQDPHNRQPVHSEEQLKTMFLRCDRLATSGLVAWDDAVRCSVVYEELKQRVFGGDFEKLVAWWSARQLNPVGTGRSDR